MGLLSKSYICDKYQQYTNRIPVELNYTDDYQTNDNPNEELVDIPTRKEIICKFSVFKDKSLDEFCDIIKDNAMLDNGCMLNVEYDSINNTIIFLVDNIPFISYPISPRRYTPILSTNDKDSKYYCICPNMTYKKCMWSNIQIFTSSDNCPTPNENGSFLINMCENLHVDDNEDTNSFVFSKSDKDIFNLSFSNDIIKKKYILDFTVDNYYLNYLTDINIYDICNKYPRYDLYDINMTLDQHQMEEIENKITIKYKF